jgi:hypothetical protein
MWIHDGEQEERGVSGMYWTEDPKWGSMAGALHRFSVLY